MKRKLALLLAAAMVFGLCGIVTAGDEGITIGISLPTQREERWVLDKEGFEKAAEAAGIAYSIQIADNNAGRQQDQCENLLSRGISALIVAPHDEEAAKNIVEMAHKEGVPVISYDRLIANAEVDLYVTFDQYYIGWLMGSYLNEHLESGNIVFLKGDPGDSTCVPLAQGAKDAIAEKLESGAYTIVLEQDCRDWEPSEALKHMENALTLTDNNIQGVIAPNDGTAGGVIQALAAQGLAGKVIVTGQDSEADAIVRVIAGTQSMTVFFDTREMSAAAFEAAVKMAKGEDPGASGFEFNGLIDVPTLQFPAEQVTPETYYALLIESGYMSEEDLK